MYMCVNREVGDASIIALDSWIIGDINGDSLGNFRVRVFVSPRASSRVQVSLKGAGNTAANQTLDHIRIWRPREKEIPKQKMRQIFSFYPIFVSSFLFSLQNLRYARTSFVNLHETAVWR